MLPRTLILGLLVGVTTGIGAFTFVYAKGASYLTDDAAACANCHVMREQLEGWIASSHRAVAVCNDCHTPPGFAAKYATKAMNGLSHSVAFTTGRFHEPIAIGPRNRAVTEAACRHCHGAIVTAIEGHPDAPRSECTRCHAAVGHLP